jgi:hypothetical protein
MDIIIMTQLFFSQERLEASFAREKQDKQGQKFFSLLFLLQFLFCTTAVLANNSTMRAKTCNAI